MRHHGCDFKIKSVTWRKYIILYSVSSGDLASGVDCMSDSLLMSGECFTKEMIALFTDSRHVARSCEINSTPTTHFYTFFNHCFSNPVITLISLSSHMAMVVAFFLKSNDNPYNLSIILSLGCVRSAVMYVLSMSPAITSSCRYYFVLLLKCALLLNKSIQYEVSSLPCNIYSVRFVPSNSDAAVRGA